MEFAFAQCVLGTTYTLTRQMLCHPDWLMGDARYQNRKICVAEKDHARERCRSRHHGRNAREKILPASLVTLY
ncbi:hypothetical protein AA0535_0152 [Asaia krungthepensis NRIC 0535]|uniref:Uncharacterized protein n=1 Tax=Asaia krungthepensis NRIC 0535 TaxID=1307925 RepID=A0ABQ0PW45_9PROT|nr:hypothetical protein AA0535_0152 [Asaia krungthepensis NRIC 0535]